MDGTNELDLARQVGMPPGVIALALSGSPAISRETRLRVQTLARSLGHRSPVSSVAGAVPIGFDGAVGVLVPLLINPFVDEFLHALQMECEGRGLLALAASSFSDPDRERAVIGKLRDMGAEAVFVLGSVQSPAALRELAESGPLAVVTPTEVGGRVDSLRFDEDEAAGLVLDHVWERGWRSVVYVPQQADGRMMWGGTRAAALESAARDRGLRFTAAARDMTLQSLVERDALTWAAEMTVVVCHTGVAAMEVSSVVRALGYAPGRHMAMIAYDDAYLASDSDNDLTAVELDMDRFVDTVVTTMLARRDAPDRPGGDRLVHPVLIARGST